MLTDATQRQHIRTAIAEAAGNIPNSGSVTQSSTGDGTTTDSVSVTVVRAADGTMSYTVREAGGWSVDRGSARVLAEPDGEGWKGIEFHQAPEGGEGSGTGPGLYVDVYTDIEAPTTRPAIRDVPNDGAGVVITGGVISRDEMAGTFNGEAGTLRCTSPRPNCWAQVSRQGGVEQVTFGGEWKFYPGDASGTPTETVQDADYLAGGIWVRVPADAASVADYEFGAFVDGNDPFRQANLAGLTGTATYTGDATAVYSYQPTNRNYFVDADVRLTADFGDASSLGSISGTVSNIRGEGPASDSYDGVSVSLGTAQIGSADSGFFTGDVTTRGTDSAFTGKWGGQFYGNGAAASDHPGSVAGTFGAATADGSESFVGAYGAERQQ